METHFSSSLLLKLWAIFLLFEVSGIRAFDIFKHNYLGCYIDANPDRRLFNSYNEVIKHNTPDNCINLCRSKNYPYAGMQDGTQCFCGNERPLFKARADEIECSTECPGHNKEKCGAKWRTSAYKTNFKGKPPKEKLNYLGCYADYETGDDRLFDKYFLSFPNGQTPHFCVGLCYSLGFGYAGLQYRFQCFCGNRHPPTERMTNDDLCNLECRGDTTEKCGGHWKLGVYSTSITDVPALGRYIGCYVDNVELNDTRVLNGIKRDFRTTNTPQLCVNFCLSNNYQYAGLQYGRECYCGNDEITTEMAPDFQCQLECPGDDTRTCGGHGRLSVYQLTNEFKSPQYLGCFKDETKDEKMRLFEGYKQKFPSSLTIQRCIDICRSKGFHYSGLQFKHECFCKDRKPPNSLQVSENNCLYPCSGDSSQICGGDWRYSVYWNGLKNPLRNEDNYIGCYRERNAPLQLLPLDSVTFERSLTPQLCIAHCFRKGYLYSGTQISSIDFGTQQRSQCNCGDFMPSTEHKTDKTDEAQCSAVCPGDQNRTCGGDWRISIYRTGVFPYNQIDAENGYLGCFHYDRRTLSQYKVDLDNNTPQRCLGICRGIGYLYAGLKNGKECYCGFKAPPSANVARETECTTPCSGDSSAACGADKAWSVYQIPRTTYNGTTKVPVAISNGVRITSIDGGKDCLKTEDTIPMNREKNCHLLEDIKRLLETIPCSVYRDTENPSLSDLQINSLNISDLQRFTLLEAVSLIRLMKLELYSKMKMNSCNDLNKRSRFETKKVNP